MAVELRRRLTLFGIPLVLDPSWFVIVVLLAWMLARGYFPAVAPDWSAPVYWGLGATASLLLFSCVLLHELGHALVARWYRIPVLGITLFFFGGVSHLGRDPLRPSVELLVALSGPLISAALALLGLVAVTAIPREWPTGLLWAALLHYLTMVNLAILCFNVLPAFPLDGGRVVRAVLWKLTGNWSRATKVASFIGALFGLSLVGLGGWTMLASRGTFSGLWYVLLGWHLFGAAQAVYRRT